MARLDRAPAVCAGLSYYWASCGLVVAAPTGLGLACLLALQRRLEQRRLMS